MISNIVSRVGKGLAGLGLVGCLLAPAQAKAEEPKQKAEIVQPTQTVYGSVEVMAGHKNSTLDIKVGDELGQGFAMFARAHTSVDYDNNIGGFGYLDLIYNLVDNFGIVTESQYNIGAGLVQRAGLQYFYLNDLLSFFLIVKFD